jgi:cytochrome d ubiquinol oxidase subunit I
MEATFIAVMFFGWNKVSKKFHLASTWLTGLGATFSAWWILVANSWMQYPVGMAFNPETVRNEMMDFASVAFSPVAVMKFLHTVLSSWILGAVFVIGVSAWYLLRKREKEFAVASIKIAAGVGLFAALVTAFSGDNSAYQVARYQPMKLAAMEGLFQGQTNADLLAFGILNPDKKSYNDSIEPFLMKVKVPIPGMLSFLGYRDFNAFVPGIKDVVDGGYATPQGPALSFAERQERGKKALNALAEYKNAMSAKDTATAQQHKAVLDENFPHFGYGYLDKPEDIVPNIPLVFYAFHIMVGLGMYFLALFALLVFMLYRLQR